MELITYDPANKTVTVKLSPEEIVDLHSLFSGVLNTYQDQDRNIIGMPEFRVEEVKNGLTTVLNQMNAMRLGKK